MMCDVLRAVSDRSNPGPRSPWWAEAKANVRLCDHPEEVEALDLERLDGATMVLGVGKSTRSWERRRRTEPVLCGI